MSRQPVPPRNKPSKVVHPVQRARHRSYSDPFSDPVYATSKPVPRLPPDPPQKHPQYNPKAFSPPKPTHHRDNMADALRDTVQFRPSDQPSRSRTGRIHLPTPLAPSRPSFPITRFGSSRSKHYGKAKPKPHGKKGSMHADVIDRLDFTGVGPMFHHDGPFDACAPSRNRHRTKAPMLAWSSNPAEEYALAPSAPYPSPDAYNGEAWGIHEPEPYEEFFAGGGATRRDGGTPSSSIYGGREGHLSRNATPQHSIGRRSKDGRDLREVYREYLDDDTRQAPSRDKDRRTKRGKGGQVSPSGQPKRTKSLMQRFRKLRENPNIPADGQFTDPPSPTARDTQGTARPTHRSQNSFLGRLAQGSGERSDRRGYTKENTSPISDGSEAFVYIDDPRREKRLPATPHTPTTTRPSFRLSGYGGANLGRRASLLKKVKDVVRGPK
ncbi:Pal1 cell morphology protein-domain-containing protein [Pisolithus thermaeus]|nr:Pal1 cell morphology protein-domain-containing protein [Pisolithus thermaeus]